LFLKGPQWLQVRQWIFAFEKLFIRHLWRDSNTRWVCSRKHWVWY